MAPIAGGGPGAPSWRAAPGPIAQPCRIVLARSAAQPWLTLLIDPETSTLKCTAAEHDPPWHYFRFADATVKPLAPGPGSWHFAPGDTYIAVTPGARQIADSPQAARFIHLHDAFNADKLAGAAVATVDVDLSGGIGEETERPRTVTDLEDRYDLGIGSLKLDLTRLELEEDTTVEAEVGIGELVVAVPPDVTVVVDAHVGAGEVAAAEQRARVGERAGDRPQRAEGGVGGAQIGGPLERGDVEQRGGVAGVSGATVLLRRIATASSPRPQTLAANQSRPPTTGINARRRSTSQPTRNVR